MISARRSRTELYLVALGLLFSGAGSLVLEVCWSRLLKLVFGSTTLAVSTILVAYMLGLGLGGLFGGRIAERMRNGVRAYGVFEIVVGLYAFCVPPILHWLPRVSASLLEPLGFWPAAFLRFAVVLVLLLVPTLLMGATLPVLVASLVRGREEMADRVGLLYGVNTLGAVLGTLGATFVLFPAFGVLRTNAIGASFDLAVGLLAVFVLAPRFGAVRAAGEPAAEAAPRPAGRWNPFLIAYGVVGFSSLAYEVAWTRAIAMITGASIYAFAVMLAAFLTGIALGALVARRWFDRVPAPRALFAAGLGLLAVLAIGTMVSFTALVDLFTLIVQWFGMEGRSAVLGALVVSFAAMLPPALVLGALFPLATRAAVAPGEAPSRVVADVYFVNTIGSALGAFAAGFALIPRLGLQQAVALLIALDLLVGIALLFAQRGWTGRPRLALAAAMGVLAVLVVVRPPFWDREQMTRGVYYKPDLAMTFGIELEPFERFEVEKLLYYRDGLNTTVSVHRSPGGVNLRLSGKADASVGDMSTQVLSGQIPALFGPAPRRALVVGYASGVTTGSVALHESVERVDVVELEPAVMEASRFFDAYNYHAQDDPKVRVIVDDGRRFLAYAPERYDIIASEPSNPWISGASNLFTREYFRYAREHLTERGRLLQWIQLYGMDAPALRSVLRALRAEFTHVYGFLAERDSSDFLLLAMNDPLGVGDLPEWDDLAEPVREDLRRVRVFGTADLWSLMVLSPRQIDELLASGEGPPNTDDNMFVELRTPWTLYNEAAEMHAFFDRFDTGVLELLGHDELARLGPERAAALARAYWAGRNQRRIGERLFAEARALGPSAELLALEALVALRTPGKDETVRRARALRLLDEALARDPRCFAARFERARLAYREGRLEAARADIDAALAIDPGQFQAADLAIQIHGALGDVERAYRLGEGQLARGLGDLHGYLYFHTAPAAAATGRLERAEELLRRGLEISPYSPREWDILAAVYREMGRADDALIAQANSRRAATNSLRLFHRHALRYARFGSIDRAREMLERVVAADPENTRARRELALLRQGRRPF
ncbi:MAG: hypothetical protein D6738_02525 [Acidobacteria bacterium]|nr:MAG: hypothetical protein D6738_02525 [Acidobacteriota bacterium]